MFLYDSHLSGVNAYEVYIGDKNYCEQCEDSDIYLGEFNTLKELWGLIKDKCDINGSGGYSLGYLFPWITELFDIDVELIFENENNENEQYCSNSEEEMLKIIEENLDNKLWYGIRKNKYRYKIVGD